MTPHDISTAAATLRDAAASGAFIAPLRERYPDLDEANAYAIQKHNNDLRLAEGRRRTGCKIGLTARAVQRQLGVDQPDFGVLFDDMCYGDSEPITFRTLQQPRVEVEIAFVLGRDLRQERPTIVDVIDAIDYALPAIEVVGSRIANWNIRFVDTVADNASAGAYVVGSRPRRLRDFDHLLCGAVVERRGEAMATGAGAACLGNPLNAVVWLARTMSRLQSPLVAGDLVMSGALAPMVTAQAGDVFEARINGVGSVRAVFGAAVEGAR